MKMYLFTLFVFLLQFRGLASQTLDVNGISLDQKVLAIERLLLTPGTIGFPVTPCTEVLNGPPNSISGDQTSAQWVRTVFHDFITANTTAGTGGLDASISFEADRPENLGLVFANGDQHISFINATILGFNLFASVFISTSDFIGLGLAVSLLSCDPDARMIDLRAGRVDATAAGPSGVPRPQDSLAIATAAFANAGFNQTDMIQAVACGHSLGGVHNNNFPEIVGNQATVGSDGTDHFDSTPFVFDNTGVNEYLNGSGQAGGPLVTTANQTFTSDLRIFTSDKNATIKAMSTATSFENTCFNIFERMINTVPKGTTLSGVIGPRPWILLESHLDLSKTGAVQYSGTITTQSKAAGTAPNTASYTYGGTSTTKKSSSAGVAQSTTVNGSPSTPFGIITNYAFNDTISSSGVTSITVQGSYNETINTNLFVVPSQSFVDNTNGAQPTYIIRAALLTSLSSKSTTLTGTLYFPAAQPNSVAPKFTQSKTTLTSFKTLGSYTIFQGIVAQGSVLAQGASISHIDVQLGTSQRSAKVMVDAAAQSGSFVGVCTNANLTTC